MRYNNTNKLFLSCLIVRHLCAQPLSHVQQFATPWTVACQATLSLEFSRQECWSELLFPTPGDLPNSWIEPLSPASLTLAGRFFTASITLEVQL